VVVDATAFALQNCVEASQGFTSGETFAVVNVGATASTISIIVEGMPAYGRDISSGGQPLHRGAGQPRASPRGGRAHQARRRAAGVERRCDRTMLQVSEAIAAEIQRSLDFFLGGRRGAAVAHRPGRRLGAGAVAAARRWPSARACR
jgi:type IV pilus assembly protein PilM